VSSRTRVPEREDEFTWEEPFHTGSRKRRPPSRRPPRKVALPIVGVALVFGLVVGYLVSGGGSTTTVTQTATVTTAAKPVAPAASGADSRPEINLAVLNGSGEAGLAASTAELVKGMGYVKVTEGNAPSQVAADRVMYRPGAEAQARQVAADLKAGAPVPLSDSSGIAAAAPDADVVAVMGPSSASQAGSGGAEDATPDGASADAPAGGGDANVGSGSPEAGAAAPVE